MPARRFGSSKTRSTRGLAVCAWVAAVASVPLSSCMFPDYKTGFIVGGGVPAAGAGATAGATGADTTGGVMAGGSAPTVSGSGAGGAQAGRNSEGGVAGGGGDAGKKGTEPFAGAAGATGETGIVIFDDFEDQDDDGWFATTPDWVVASDGTSQVYRIANLLDESLFSVIGDLDWADVTIEAKVTVLEWGGTNTSDLVGVYARFQSEAIHYYVALRSDGKLALRKKVDTNMTIGTPVDLALTTGVQYRVKLEIVGDQLDAYVDDVLQLRATDPEIAAGRVGLGADFARAEFDDVRVTLR